jgi:hypothetical protein
MSHSAYHPLLSKLLCKMLLLLCKLLCKMPLLLCMALCNMLPFQSVLHKLHFAKAQVGLCLMKKSEVENLVKQSLLRRRLWQENLHKKIYAFCKGFSKKNKGQVLK